MKRCTIAILAALVLWTSPAFASYAAGTATIVVNEPVPDIAVTPPTAFQTWMVKVQQLLRIKDAQDAGVVFPAQEITDLKTAVNTGATGIQSGYAAQF